MVGLAGRADGGLLRPHSPSDGLRPARRPPTARGQGRSESAAESAADRESDDRRVAEPQLG